MFELTDTIFRAYKKKYGAISLHHKGYLLVHTNIGFRLSAYLKDMRCWITLPGNKEVMFDSVGFSDRVQCKFDQHVMVHDLWLSTIIRNTSIELCVADFRMMYHISFTGLPSEKPEFLERKVLVIPRF